MKTLRLVKMLAFVALLGTSSAAYGQDIVVTMSGDRLVGEIQKVEKDVVTLATPIQTRISRSSGGTSSPFIARGSSWWRPSKEG